MIKNNISTWSISSDLILQEAKNLGIEVEVVHQDKNLFLLIQGEKRILFKNIDCGLNSALGFKLTEDKELTYLLLENAGIPVPKSVYLKKETLDSFRPFIIDIAFPLVTKPIDGAHGDGVVVNIKNKKELKVAIEISFDHSDTIVVQNFVTGDDHRVLVVGDQVVAVAKRQPAFIIGDGISTIRTLVEKENMNPLRGGGDHSTPLSPIKLDNESTEYLNKNGLSEKSIVTAGQLVYVRGNANLSTGGKSIDLTESIHPSIVSMAVQASKIVGLQVAGVDILTSDISKPLAETGGVIIEINATPGLRMHHFPSEGTARNPAKNILCHAFNI